MTPSNRSSGEERSGERSWLILTYGFAALFFLLHLRWQWLDRAPPAWDESGYLLQATVLFKAWDTSLWAVVQQFFGYDPGRGGFTSVLVQPFFMLFGASLDSAMIAYAFAWFVAAWAISGIAREAGMAFFGFEPKRARAAGCLAFVLFAVNPHTVLLSQSYLVEFPLAVITATTIYCTLAYRQSQKFSWLIGGGIAAGCGMLTKVTFPIFLVPAILIHLRTLWDMGWQWRTLAAALLPVLAGVMVCGPFYYKNLYAIYLSTKFLASSQLARSFSLGDRFDAAALLDFVLQIVRTYEFALCFVATVALIVIVLRNRSQDRRALFGVVVFGLWFVLPFLAVGLSAFKEERYYYPAEVSLAVLAGLMLSQFAEGRRRAVLVAVLLIPAVKVAWVNDLMVPDALARHLTIMARPPTSNDHKVAALVDTIAETLEARKGPIDADRVVVLLGATSQHCHGTLLRYTTMVQGKRLNFILLPTFFQPDMNAQDALEFLKKNRHDAVLQKVDTAFPEKFVALDAQVASVLSSDPDYVRLTLPFQEPDGCAFAMFLDPHPWLTRITAEHLDALSRGRLLAPAVRLAEDYELSAVVGDEDSAVAQIYLRWKALEPVTLSKAAFVHLLDGQGNIIGQFDRPQAPRPERLEAGYEWLDIIPVSKDLLNTAHTLALGVYDPALGGHSALMVTGGPSDWDGRRLLLPLHATGKKP